MTLLASISPASKSMVGFVLVLPPIRLAEPWALRKPLAVATTVYNPAGAVRLKSPFWSALTDVTRVFPLYRLTVTGLPASTFPVSVPFGRGVAVAVGGMVGDPTGVPDVGVAVSMGVDEVGVAVPTGVSEVGVGDPDGVSEVGVEDPDGVSEVGVAVSTGVDEVGVGEPAGVSEVGVGVSIGVGVDDAVGALPTTVRVVPLEGRLVSTLSPLETRTVH